MTNVFNVFVVLQIFNLVNARKIDGSFNIFDGFFANGMFLGVLVAICVLQVLMV